MSDNGENTRDDLSNPFKAILHVSSIWRGDITNLASNRVRAYFVIGDNDEYYGSSRISQSYDRLVDEYLRLEMSHEEISKLAILNIKDDDYFNSVGASNQHGGGSFIAYDNSIMSWLFNN